jgi:hypothetical protein
MKFLLASWKSLTNFSKILFKELVEAYKKPPMTKKIVPFSKSPL